MAVGRLCYAKAALSFGQGEINFPLTRRNNMYQKEGNYFPLDACLYRRGNGLENGEKNAF